MTECKLSQTSGPFFRFYDKLPEVKKQREEEQRKKTYSNNRDKAKEYQQVRSHNHMHIACIHTFIVSVPEDTNAKKL